MNTNRKLFKHILVILLFLGVGGVTYYMNYSMIVTYDELDENAPDFPFGERHIDARPFIMNQGFIKINDYLLYNPNVVPVTADNIKHYMMMLLDDEKETFPELYKKYKQYDGVGKGYPAEKIQKIQYLYSSFRNESNLPDQDKFLIIFDGGKHCIRFDRIPDPRGGYFYDLYKLESTETFMRLDGDIVERADKIQEEVELRNPKPEPKSTFSWLERIKQFLGL